MFHHILVNVLEPIYERCFLFDSYACCKGKGTHAAMHRAQHFARHHAWAWNAGTTALVTRIERSA